MCMFNTWNKNKSIFDVVLEEKIGQKAQPPLKWILDSYYWCDGAERDIGDGRVADRSDFFTVGAKLDVESRSVIKPTLSCVTFQVPVVES